MQVESANYLRVKFFPCNAATWAGLRSVTDLDADSAQPFFRLHDGDNRAVFQVKFFCDFVDGNVPTFRLAISPNAERDCFGAGVEGHLRIPNKITLALGARASLNSLAAIGYDK